MKAKGIIYLVQFRIGSFDDTVFISIFATFEKKTAQKYKEKFNRIVLEAKKHYLTNDGELKEKYENTFIQDIYFEYGEVDRCFVRKIEIR
jgi:uncharacterized protein YktB (UPF0637 family)